MKLLGVILAAIFVGFGIIILIYDEPGYILINYAGWSIETALPVFLLVLGIAYLLFYYFSRVSSNLWFVKQRWGSWQLQRHRARAHAALENGLEKIWEGDWIGAEKLLAKGAKDTTRPIYHYLSAAEAAQHQGALSRRDHYLKLAEKRTPEAHFTISMKRAELLVTAGQFHEALAVVERLRPMATDNVQLKRLYAQIYYELKDWDHLTTALDQLRRYPVANETAFHRLQIEAYANYLARSLMEDDDLKVANAWIRVPQKLRTHPIILPLYVQNLILQGENAQAERLLTQAIKKQWDQDLVVLYGLTKAPNVKKQLRAIENWLNKAPNDPIILQAAARICVNNKLWGKAKYYYEASIAAVERHDTYKELGDLLDQMGESSKAAMCYQKGLALKVPEEIEISIDDKDRPVEKILTPIKEESRGLSRRLSGSSSRVGGGGLTSAISDRILDRLISRSNRD